MVVVQTQARVHQRRYLVELQHNHHLVEQLDMDLQVDLLVDLLDLRVVVEVVPAVLVVMQHLLVVEEQVDLDMLLVLLV